MDFSVGGAFSCFKFDQKQTRQRVELGLEKSMDYGISNMQENMEA